VTMSAEQAPLGDGERILAVEDNDRVREATVRRLEALGYTVLKPGQEAKQSNCSKLESKLPSYSATSLCQAE
jgi:hypothetical protein